MDSTCPDGEPSSCLLLHRHYKSRLILFQEETKHRYIQEQDDADEQMGTIADNEPPSDRANGHQQEALKALGTLCEQRTHVRLDALVSTNKSPDLLPSKVQILVTDDVKRRLRHGIDDRGNTTRKMRIAYNKPAK